ncbi:hypothetical protein GSQ53_21025, partial [Clostridioides difficile]|nr:hypothetical protein [Clostridioides difficile]
VYDEDKIIVVRPNTQFAPKDTLNFDDEFCKTIYQEGYEIGKNYEELLKYKTIWENKEGFTYEYRPGQYELTKTIRELFRNSE